MDAFTSISELTLPGGSDWDFITFDAASQTVLCGRRADGVSIVDARDPSTLVYKGSVSNTYGTNGVTLLPDLGLGVSNNGALGAMSATVFVLPSASNSWIPRVLGVTNFTVDLNSPGNSVWHPAQFKVAFTHHHRSNATGALPSVLGIYSLDSSLRGCPTNCPAACPVTGCLTLASTTVIRLGKLHSPKVADATSVWLTVEIPGAVVRISLVTGAVVQLFDLRSSGCARATPLDLDVNSGTLFVGCAGAALAGGAGLYSPLLMALNASSGTVLFSSPVGRHVDDLYYVPPMASRTGRVFITCSGDATILVFEQLAGKLRPLEAIATQLGTKTMGYDAARRIIYTGAPKGSCALGGVALDAAAALMAVGGEPFYPTGNTQGTCSIAPGLVQWWQGGTWRLMAFQAQQN